jgi:uncharacterized protein
MEIDLTELTADGVRVDEGYGGDDLVSAPDLERSVPLGARLTAWVRPEGSGARVTGEITATVRAECDRCLKPVEVAVAGTFDQRYVWTGEDVTAPSLLVEPDALDVERLDGPTFDTRTLAREQIELNVPIRVVCAEDCAGLCPICRADRNATTCNCEDEPADPRWAALQDIKSN